MSALPRMSSLALLLAVAAGIAACGCGRGDGGDRKPRQALARAQPGQGATRTAAAKPRRAAPASVAAAPAEAQAEPASGASGASGEALRYVAIGGGATPENTEVSLEQHLLLLREVLPGPGLLLFAGGPESASVRELDPAPPADPLLVRLGELFQPRPGRGSRYRASTLTAATASRGGVEAALEAALSRGDDPLMVYFASHGEQGEHPRDNSVVLWGGGALSVQQLATLHDAHPRPLRVINAACFSGGFGELAFAHADAERGPARAPRCGLFAGTWDRETSGCDPDPDRRNQEGYSLHFLQALRGRDRDGRALAADAIDFDQDGRVSLLEAHARAAIAARSIDVPTTTSQRYLRAVQSVTARSAGELLPEERAVARELGAALRLRSEAEAKQRKRALSAQLDALDARLREADAQVDDRYGELAARLLGRWPVLDDAYHPQFAPTLARERAAIAVALDTWPEALRYAAAERGRGDLEQRFQALEVEEARLLRVLRAHETLGLAEALRRRGGPQFRRYLELLACERFVAAAP